MKTYMQLILCFFIFISCNPNKEFIYEKNYKSFEEYKVMDTVDLSGFIIFYPKELPKFYITNTKVIVDTLQYIKNGRGHHSVNFIQPHTASKYGIYSNFERTDEKASEEYINNVKFNGKFISISIEDESFLLLINNKKDSLITFKQWKPYIASEPR